MTILRRRAIPLLAILALALALRLDGLAFGLPALYDPDEPIFVLIALKLIRDHTLNPAWFGHPGTTTIYTLALIDLAVYAFGAATGRFANPAALAQAIYADPSVVFLPSRVFILVCGLAVVLLTWWLARRLFGERVAAIAALLLAVDPIHIRYSQIIRTDMHASVFVLLVIIAAVAACRTGRLRDFALAGIWLGFACATKWPSIAGAAAFLGAAGWRAWRHPGERLLTLPRLAVAVAASVAALFVATPYVFLDYATVRRNLVLEGRPVHLGATGHGFAGNLLWYLDTPLHVALGVAGLAFAALGIWAGARRVPIFAVTVLPVAAVFLAMISAQKLIWERWTVPLLPLLTIMAAVGIDALARWIATRTGRSTERPALALLSLTVLLPTLLAARAQAVERRNDTRALASAWVFAHVPPGGTVALEYPAFDLLTRTWPLRYSAGDAGCIDGRAYLRGEIRYSTIDSWRGGRAIMDLGAIAPERLPTCRADYAIFVNYDRYLAERDLFPAEVAGYDRLLAHGRIVATFRPVPGRVGGPIVRIVAFDAGWKPASVAR